MQYRTDMNPILCFVVAIERAPIGRHYRRVAGQRYPALVKSLEFAETLADRCEAADDLRDKSIW